MKSVGKKNTKCQTTSAARAIFCFRRRRRTFAESILRAVKRLVIAADVDPSFRAAATRDGRFDVVDRPATTEDALAAVIGDAQIVVTRSYNRVSRRVIEAAPRLELIPQGPSGPANINLDST